MRTKGRAQRLTQTCADSNCGKLKKAYGEGSDLRNRSENEITKSVALSFVFIFIYEYFSPSVPHICKCTTLFESIEGTAA